LLETAPIADSVSTVTRARILNQKAFALGRSGNFAAAKEALDRAYDLACTSASQALLAEIEIGRCTVSFYLAEYEKLLTRSRRTRNW